MKGKKIIATAVLSMFVFNVGLGGLAASDVPVEKPAVEIAIDNGLDPVEVSFGNQEVGLTPDKSLYGIKRLLEKVQLYLAFSPEDRVELLIELAQKRLAEAQAMDEQGRDELVEVMVKEYIDNLGTAQENLKDAQLDLEAYNEVLTKIEMLLSINLDLLENIKDKLPEVEENISIIKDNLKVIKDTIIFVGKLEAEALKEDKVNEEKETEQKEEKVNNYGSGELRFVQILAEKANITTEEVMKLRETGLGWGNVAQELGISLGSVARELNQYLIVLDEEVEDTEVDLEKTKEDLEENMTRLVRKIQDSKDKDFERLRKELEEAKESLSKRQDNNGSSGKVPALVEEMLKEKKNN